MCVPFQKIINAVVLMSTVHVLIDLRSQLGVYRESLLALCISVLVGNTS